MALSASQELGLFSNGRFWLVFNAALVIFQRGVSWFLGFLFSGFAGFWVSGFLGFRASWFLGFLVSGLLGFWVSGFLGFRVSGFPGFWASGFPGVWVNQPYINLKQIVNKHQINSK